MTGQTILHFTRWDKRVRLLGLYCQKAKNSDIEVDSNLLSNGVNKITEKLGEAGLLTTCIGQIYEVTNG